MMRALLVTALSIMPAGCQRPAPEAQVLARVNGAEISLRGLGAAGTRQELRAALDRVIDQELLVQRALALGLEREPGVAAEIDAARREVLARAYVDRLTASAAAGASDDARRGAVHAFYAENPALFAERRIYELRELRVAARPGLLEALREEGARAPSLEALAAWLRSRGVPFERAALTQPAEELPLADLQRLARMKAGEIAVFERPDGGAAVIQLARAEPAPLSEAQAAARIARFLAARRRLEATAAEVRRLRAGARIEYTQQSTP